MAAPWEDQEQDKDFGGPSDDLKVRVDPATQVLHLNNLEITDRDVITEARRWSTGVRGDMVELEELAAADLTPFIREAISVGARVLALASQSSDALALQNTVRQATEEVTGVVDRAKSATTEVIRATQQTLADATDHMNRQLAAEVTKLFGGDNPELLEKLKPVLADIGPRLSTQVAETLATAQTAMVEDAERRHREIASMLTDVRREVAVRVAADEAAAEATDAVKSVTTIKGFDYETQIHAVCASIAADFGDEYLEVGDSAGRLRYNKKGDGVFSINGGIARVVVEAHDGSSKDWNEYLREAERNRGASASIGLVRCLDDNAGRVVRVIGPKRLVVAFDPADPEGGGADLELLRTIVLLMKTVAATSTGISSEEEISSATTAVQEALEFLEGLDEAKKSANAILGHVEKIESSINKTVGNMRRELNAALEALLGASKSVAAPTQLLELETPDDRDETTDLSA